MADKISKWNLIYVNDEQIYSCDNCSNRSYVITPYCCNCGSRMENNEKHLHHWIINRGIILTSIPPQYGCRCKYCGKKTTMTGEEINSQIAEGHTTEDVYEY